MLFLHFLLQFLGFSNLVHMLTAEQNVDVVFVILSQANRYHAKLAEIKKHDIIHQCGQFNYQAKVYLTHSDFEDIRGAWTIFPLFQRLSALSNNSWIFFLEDVTALDLKQLLFILSSYDASQDYFLGYALKDRQSTIIHHFDSPVGYSAISYPDFSVGFAISSTLIKKLALRWNREQKLEFSIDAGYELAKFIARGKTTSVKLLHEPHFCLFGYTSGCASWIHHGTLNCGKPVPERNLHFAVKTCERFHNDRVQVVLNTWAKEASTVYFFSDADNSSIPTINLGIPNVLKGHCQKTLSLLKYAFKNQSKADWLIVADDDTLLSVKRLSDLLACYDSTKPLAIGERYGYGVTIQHGYDYITGGGGMVFSKRTVEAIIVTCQCPSEDSPDDMIIGVCLKNLDIPIIHSSNFHQARPEDYSMELLSHQRPVSFHKHWMVDPYHIYKTWLKNSEYSVFHSEL